MNKLFTKVTENTKAKIGKTVIGPLNDIVDENITDIVTTLGSFVIRSIRGKFQRSITFSIGTNYADAWMEEALYGILYKYNNIRGSSRLALGNKKGVNDGSAMYYRLADGTHNLKYRKYDILLCIQSINSQSLTDRIKSSKVYTIITYDLSPEFVYEFERDMLAHRNSLIQIKSNAPTVNVFQDYHEGDGYTYWEKTQMINKRRLNTIYLPRSIKAQIINTVNGFFASKEYYRKHGIAHNLKILLHGLPGTGKDSIAKMIASEWNRNIFYVTGGKDGKFIPNAITDSFTDMINPMFIISDIDKYPFLINEPDMEMKDKDDASKEASIKHKQLFGSMINALDGVLSGEDKIILMTTNHIDKFSPTFLRPGRIDLNLEIPPINEEVFIDYVRDFYNVELPKDIKLKDQYTTIGSLQFDAVFSRMSFDEFTKKYLK